MWREYDKLDPYPQMSEDEKEEWYAKRVPHWKIEYCHKPRYNRRAAMFTISEDKLYETEIEATVVFYKEYIEKVKNNLEGFERKFKRLGIEMPSLKLLPSKEKYHKTILTPKAVTRNEQSPFSFPIPCPLKLITHISQNVKAKKNKTSQNTTSFHTFVWKCQKQ